MKLRKINILASIALVAVFAFSSCSKDDGAIPSRVGIEEIPAISTNTEAGGTTGTITLANQAAFEGKFKLVMWFADQKAPDKIDVVVRKNGSAANVKLYKSNVTTLPVNYSITAAEIVTLFGAPLALNDTYDFAPDIYIGTKKYEAFPAVGNGAGQSITGMSAIGYGAWVRYSVK